MIHWYACFLWGEKNQQSALQWNIPRGLRALHGYLANNVLVSPTNLLINCNLHSGNLFFNPYLTTRGMFAERVDEYTNHLVLLNWGLAYFNRKAKVSIKNTIWEWSWKPWHMIMVVQNHFSIYWGEPWVNMPNLLKKESPAHWNAFIKTVFYQTHSSFNRCIQPLLFFSYIMVLGPKTYYLWPLLFFYPSVYLF